jgi:hypothetical protein
VGGAAVLAHADAGGVSGDDVAERRRAEIGSVGASARVRRLTNRASVAATGRAAYHPPSALCASVCSGTVRVRPRFDPRTTSSSWVCSPRLGAIAVRPALVGLAAAFLHVGERQAREL